MLSMLDGSWTILAVFNKLQAVIDQDGSWTILAELNLLYDKYAYFTQNISIWTASVCAIKYGIPLFNC